MTRCFRKVLLQANSAQAPSNRIRQNDTRGTVCFAGSRRGIVDKNMCVAKGLTSNLRDIGRLPKWSAGHAVEISLPEPIGLSLNPTVQEIMTTLEQMSCAKIES